MRSAEMDAPVRHAQVFSGLDEDVFNFDDSVTTRPEVESEALEPPPLPPPPRTSGRTSGRTGDSAAQPWDAADTSNTGASVTQASSSSTSPWGEAEALEAESKDSSHVRGGRDGRDGRGLKGVGFSGGFRALQLPRPRALGTFARRRDLEGKKEAVQELLVELRLAETVLRAPLSGEMTQDILRAFFPKGPPSARTDNASDVTTATGCSGEASSRCAAMRLCDDEPLDEVPAEFGPLPVASKSDVLPMPRVLKFNGFRLAAINCLFLESQAAGRAVGGRETYWSVAGGYFLFYSPFTRTWAVERTKRFEQIRSGRGGILHGREDYDVWGPPCMDGWREWDRDEKVWLSCGRAGVEARGRARFSGAAEVARPSKPIRPPPLVPLKPGAGGHAGLAARRKLSGATGV